MDCMNEFQIVDAHRKLLRRKSDISREKHVFSLKSKFFSKNEKKNRGKNGLTNIKLLSLHPIKQQFVSITPTSVISNHCPVRTDPGLEI